MPQSSIRQKYTLRPAIASDIPHLASIERSAGQLFRTVGLDSVADDEPMPAEVLEGYLSQENIWVASIDNSPEGNGEVVGFLAAFPITVTGHEGSEQQQQQLKEERGKEQRRPEQPMQLIHIAELSIHASHHRRGLGTRLLNYSKESIKSRSQDTQITGMSLTTYAPVAFNGPFYRNQGFEVVPPTRILEVVGKRGRELWEEEQKKIVRPEWRCWMVKWLDGRNVEEGEK